jgi:uncharacterized protein YejL (UPF0352 family)
MTNFAFNIVNGTVAPRQEEAPAGDLAETLVFEPPTKRPRTS